MDASDPADPVDPVDETAGKVTDDVTGDPSDTAAGPSLPRFRGDPAELYEIDPEIAEELTDTDPVLVVALDGYVDAGSGVELVVDQLTSTLPYTPVVTFDTDRVVDYRSRRPALTFEDNAFTAYDTPQLAMYRMRDATGTPFVLFTGPEPDLSWEKLSAAVLQIARQLGIRLAVSMMAIPMGVPHTRPAGMTVHATDPELIAGATNWLGSVEVPGHFSGLLEYRLGEAGFPAVGFAAHVPHYLARSEYPITARALLEATADKSGLSLPLDGFSEAIEKTQAELTEQISEHSEVAEVVRALEHQYDQFMEAKSNSLLADGDALPTADELGAQFEAFLADQNKSGPDN